MNAREIAKFIKKAVEDLSLSSVVKTYYLKLDNDFAIYVGWCGGFDPNDDSEYYHSNANPDYCLCAKVAEWNPASIDYEWMYMPWDVNTNEVWDSETTLTRYDDIYLVAKYLNEDYRAMKKALAKGEITFGK